MSDHSARPRIESVGTFVLTVDAPCVAAVCESIDNDFTVDIPGVGEMNWETGGVGYVDIGADLPIADLCTNYFAMYTAIRWTNDDSGSINIGTNATDDSVVEGWEDYFNMPDDTIAYRPGWGDWQQIAQSAPVRSGAKDVSVFVCFKMLPYPVLNGTRVTSNITGSFAQVLDSVKIFKGGNVAPCTRIAQGAFGDAMLGPTPLAHNAFFPYDWDGSVMSAVNESIFFGCGYGALAEGDSCFIHFGEHPDGSLSIPLNMLPVVGGSSSQVCTTWSGPPCVSDTTSYEVAATMYYDPTTDTFESAGLPDNDANDLFNYFSIVQGVPATSVPCP